MNNQYNTSLATCPACQNGVSRQAASCPRCGQPLQIASYQQPQFQQNFSPPVAKSGGIGRTFGVGCLGLIGFLVVVGLIGSIALPKRNTVENQTVQNTQVNSASTLQTNETVETKVNPSIALANLRKKVMSVPASKQVFSKIEAGDIPRVLKVYVKDTWDTVGVSEKRSLTTNLFNLWKQELGTDNAILHIYDESGHEVAGTKTLGGVWVEGE